MACAESSGCANCGISELRQGLFARCERADEGGDFLAEIVGHDVADIVDRRGDQTAIADTRNEELVAKRTGDKNSKQLPSVN